MFDAFALRVVVCGAVLVAVLSTASAQTTPDATATSAPVTPAAPPAKVVIIPTRSAGGPNLSKEAQSLVEVPLARSATIVSYATYKSAVLAAGHNQKEIADINTIRSVAAAAGITHAVVVEGSTSTESENGKSVKVNTVEVSLIDAPTGAVLYTTKRTLTGARLTRSVSTPVVAVLAEKLAASAPPPPVQPEPPVPVVPVPPPPVVAPVVVAPTECVAPAPVEAKPSTPEPAAPIAVDEAPVRSSVVEMHPTLQLRLGVLAMARDGRITSVDGRASFDGPLVAVNLSAAYFPFARREAKRPERGVGIYGEGYLTGASAKFNATEASRNSTVGAIDIGGAYRFPLSQNDDGPVITLQLGYAYASWPLGGVVFPGIHYSSPEVGFVVDAPIVPHVALFVGGRFLPWLSMGGQADRLGNVDTAYAFRGDIGVRLVLAPFELVLSGRYQQYNGDFNGVSQLGLASELGDVHYVDRYYGGSASVGYTF